MMNVLKITSTPIKLSMTSQRARLEAQLPSPHVNMEQTPGSIQMHSQNIKVNIDTYEQRQSLGRRTSQDFLAYQADKGKAAAQDATARYVQVGNQMAQIQKGANIPDIICMQMSSQMQPRTDLEAMPLPPPDISWTPGSLEMKYTPSSIEFERISKMQRRIMYRENWRSMWNSILRWKSSIWEIQCMFRQAPRLVMRRSARIWDENEPAGRAVGRKSI